MAHTESNTTKLIVELEASEAKGIFLNLYQQVQKRGYFLYNLADELEREEKLTFLENKGLIKIDSKDLRIATMSREFRGNEFVGSLTELGEEVGKKIS